MEKRQAKLRSVDTKLERKGEPGGGAAAVLLTCQACKSWISRTTASGWHRNESGVSQCDRMASNLQAAVGLNTDIDAVVYLMYF